VAAIAYCYHIKSTAGFIFFAAVGIIFALTRYFESEEFSLWIKKTLKACYFIALPTGGVYLYQAIAGTPSQNVTSTYVIVMLVSVSFYGLVLVNIINLLANGQDAFIEFNNSTLKSEQLRENQEKAQNLDEFMKR
jgi:hypothetical protein